MEPAVQLRLHFQRLSALSSTRNSERGVELLDSPLLCPIEVVMFGTGMQRAVWSRCFLSGDRICQDSPWERVMGVYSDCAC